MLEDLDTKSAVPLYDQIAVRVRAAVATGELHAGDLLPSVRQLAGRLRINPATVTHDADVFSAQLKHGRQRSAGAALGARHGRRSGPLRTLPR